MRESVRSVAARAGKEGKVTKKKESVPEEPKVPPTKDATPPSPSKSYAMVFGMRPKNAWDVGALKVGSRIETAAGAVYVYQHARLVGGQLFLAGSVDGKRVCLLNPRYIATIAEPEQEGETVMEWKHAEDHFQSTLAMAVK